MNFKNYVNDILNESGYQLNEMLQSEIEAYRKKWGDNNKLTKAIAEKYLVI